MRYYKHFEVFLHGQDSIVVTGLSRAQVGRDTKKVKGPDMVDEVKPISVHGVERKYGKNFDQTVKVNTISLTPPNKDPYINENMDYSTTNYGYYEVHFVGTDETEVIIGASLESVTADMHAQYGEDEIMKVVEIQSGDMVSSDEAPPPTKFSILSGYNAFVNGQIQEKRGLWDNIHAKRKRIKAGSGEKMRKPGSKDAPSDADLKNSQSEACSSPFQKKIKSIKEGEPPVKPRVIRNPQNKDSVEEDRNPIMEGEDKLMYLARVGLMPKTEVVLLKRALAAKRTGMPLTVQNRDLLLKLMERLVQLVMNHSHMFNHARRKVMEEVINEVEDRVVSEMWNNLMDYFAEAGYMDPPKTSAEMKKKFPNVKTDVKNKDSIDLTPIQGE